LVVAITIASIIVGFIGMFMATPLQAYFAQSQRTDLADSSDAIVRTLEQDVPMALPNSLRVYASGPYKIVQMLLAADSARYWKSGETGSGARELDFTAADGQFATVGTFNAATVALPPGTFYLSVNNQGVVGADAYALANVITPAAEAIGLVNSAAETQVTLNPAFQFNGTAPPGSPGNRVYVVTGPVAYVCDEGAHTVTRYWNYSISTAATNPSSPAAFVAAGAASSQVASYPTACQFGKTNGSATSGGVLSVSVMLSKGGDTLRLFHQVAVKGLP
jgi:MSHA biogenesis protein MshO